MTEAVVMLGAINDASQTLISHVQRLKSLAITGAATGTVHLFVSLIA